MALIDHEDPFQTKRPAFIPPQEYWGLIDRYEVATLTFQVVHLIPHPMQRQRLPPVRVENGILFGFDEEVELKEALGEYSSQPLAFVETEPDLEWPDEEILRY